MTGVTKQISRIFIPVPFIEAGLLFSCEPLTSDIGQHSFRVIKNPRTSDPIPQHRNNKDDNS